MPEEPQSVEAAMVELNPDGMGGYICREELADGETCGAPVEEQWVDVFSTGAGGMARMDHGVPKYRLQESTCAKGHLVMKLD